MSHPRKRKKHRPPYKFGEYYTKQGPQGLYEDGGKVVKEDIPKTNAATRSKTVTDPYKNRTLQMRKDWQEHSKKELVKKIKEKNKKSIANIKSKLKGAYQKATKGAGAGMPGDDALTRHSPGTKIKIK